MKHGGGGKRRDASEPAIIDALRKCGAFVRQVHGDGAPDLIVYFKGMWLPMECKSDKGRVSAAQAEAAYPIVRTPAQALAHFGVRLLP
jgi:hypothetical protein